MKRTTLFMFTLVLALAALASTMVVSAQNDCTRVVVTEADITRQAENTPPTDNWVLYTRTPSSYGAFTIGPDTPPLGVGSLETRTPTGADKVFLNNYDYAGKLLSGISQLSYSTYQFSTDPTRPNQLPAINIAICQNGVDANGNCLGFTTLVYEPVYNNGNQAIVPTEWQTWDAFSGVWWSTRPLNGMSCAGAVVACMQDLSTIIANNPNAVIISVGINQGSGNDGLNAATDALSLTYDGACKTYDFEPFRVAATKDDCKNESYKNFRRADGSTFKNQGQCIQYVNTGK